MQSLRYELFSLKHWIWSAIFSYKNNQYMLFAVVYHGM